VAEYRKRRGFTPQKPVKKGREQKPEEVDRWLTTDYPKIVRRARKEKAASYWGNETGMQNDANRTSGYAPGEEPFEKSQ
jgi:hypothetical protein